MSMMAVVREKYGGPEVIHLEEIEKPTPGEGQVLVKVSAVSLNRSDWYQLTAPGVMRLMNGGIRRPKSRYLGSDISGRVEAVGAGVSKFKPGDEVFGCGFTGLAEYTLARDVRVVKKPEEVGFEEAAAVPVAALTALQGLRKGGAKPGTRVLVYGASGGVGTFAIQIAKALGAEVTAVCSSRNVEAARAMGADHVIDYSKEDYTKNGQRYDLILAVNGYRSIFSHRRALASNGVFLLVGSSKIWTALISVFILGPIVSRLGGKKMGFMGIAKITEEDLLVLAGMMESGEVKPVVERRYPFAESAEAFRYLGDGHARGKLVVTV